MIVWGDTLCSLCRHRVAECVLLADRERYDEPFCLHCADLWLERQGLLLSAPELAARLAALEDVARDYVAA